MSHQTKNLNSSKTSTSSKNHINNSNFGNNNGSLVRSNGFHHESAYNMDNMFDDFNLTNTNDDDDGFSIVDPNSIENTPTIGPIVNAHMSDNDHFNDLFLQPTIVPKQTSSHDDDLFLTSRPDHVKGSNFDIFSIVDKPETSKNGQVQTNSSKPISNDNDNDDFFDDFSNYLLPSLSHIEKNDPNTSKSPSTSTLTSPTPSASSSSSQSISSNSQNNSSKPPIPSRPPRPNMNNNSNSKTTSSTANTGVGGVGGDHNREAALKGTGKTVTNTHNSHSNSHSSAAKPSDHSSHSHSHSHSLSHSHSHHHKHSHTHNNQHHKHSQSHSHSHSHTPNINLDPVEDDDIVLVEDNLFKTDKKPSKNSNSPYIPASLSSPPPSTQNQLNNPSILLHEVPHHVSKETYEILSKRQDLDLADARNEFLNYNSEDEMLLKLFCCTWNMFGRPPPSLHELEQFIVTGVHDIYVIGSEECENSINKSLLFSSKAKWVSALTSIMGDTYVQIAAETMQAIHIIIFARRELCMFINNVETEHIPTGLGDILGNKGAVAVSMDIGTTPFLFVNSHFQSGEGSCMRRNADYHKVNGRLSLRAYDYYIKQRAKVKNQKGIVGMGSGKTVDLGNNSNSNPSVPYGHGYVDTDDSSWINFDVSSPKEPLDTPKGGVIGGGGVRGGQGVSGVMGSMGSSDIKTVSLKSAQEKAKAENETSNSSSSSTAKPNTKVKDDSSTTASPTDSIDSLPLTISASAPPMPQRPRRNTNANNVNNANSNVEPSIIDLFDIDIVSSTATPVVNLDLNIKPSLNVDLDSPQNSDKPSSNSDFETDFPSTPSETKENEKNDLKINRNASENKDVRPSTTHKRDVHDDSVLSNLTVDTEEHGYFSTFGNTANSKTANVNPSIEDNGSSPTNDSNPRFQHAFKGFKPTVPTRSPELSHTFNNGEKTSNTDKSSSQAPAVVKQDPPLVETPKSTVSTHSSYSTGSGIDYYSDARLQEQLDQQRTHAKFQSTFNKYASSSRSVVPPPATQIARKARALRNYLPPEHQMFYDDLLHPQQDAVSRFPCVIWMGDLNYRVQALRRVVDYMLKHDMIHELLSADELIQQLAQNQVFEGFKEGLLTFPPTYKYDVGTNRYDTSEKNRVPSWTDRILWKSSNKYMLLEKYYSCQKITSSDHKPVMASFLLKVGRGQSAPIHIDNSCNNVCQTQ